MKASIDTRSKKNAASWAESNCRFPLKFGEIDEGSRPVRHLKSWVDGNPLMQLAGQWDDASAREGSIIYDKLIADERLRSAYFRSLSYISYGLRIDRLFYRQKMAAR